MLACIYCRGVTSGREPPDHPVPKALGTAPYSLPPGAVCIVCNTYLGDLDRNLCNHHHLAAMIVFGGLKGSKGRVRQIVHPDFSFDVRTQHAKFLVTPRVSVEQGPGRLAFTHPGYTDFDEWKFSRGLHRMALGVLGLAYGPEITLAERFEEVRAYIRCPTGRHIRPYYQRITDKRYGNRTLPRALMQYGYHFIFELNTMPALAYLNLFVDEFLVALDSSLTCVAPEEASAFAASADVPKETLSRRPWGLLPFARMAGSQ